MPSVGSTTTPPDPAALAHRVRTLAREFGFQRCGIAGIELGDDERHLRDWLAEGLYGSMEWMAQHGDKRSRPQELIPGTLRVISVGLDYGRNDSDDAWDTLHDGERAYVARYALGRDYHKLMRNRLQKLAECLQQEVGAFGHRVFVDPAPVLERALARNAGLGWIGKHTCLIDKDGGSWFFLGEVYVDLPLPVDRPPSAHLRALHRRLPDAGDHRTVPARCAPLHLLPDPRPRWRDSGRAAPGDRQPHLRLRRLPARVSLEQVRQAHGRTGFPRTQRA